MSFFECCQNTHAMNYAVCQLTLALEGDFPFPIGLARLCIFFFFGVFKLFESEGNYNIKKNFEKQL